MPVFICHCHLIYDLLDVLISSFYNAIHLRPIRRRVMMLDLKLRAKLGNHSVIEIGTIIRDDSFWNTIPINKVMSDEPGHNVLCNRSK